MDKKGKFVEYGIMLLVILCVIFIILGITLLMLSKVKEDIYEYSCFEDLANYHCNQINWVVKDMDLDNYTYNCMIACGHGLNKKSFSEWEIQNCSITTALACKRTNRNFLGIEINQAFIDIANKRLQQEVLQ